MENNYEISKDLRESSSKFLSEFANYEKCLTSLKDTEKESFTESEVNEILNLLDITFLISYLYKDGPAPEPVTAGDANCDTTVNILDITYLISYLYKGGPAPCI